MKLLLAAVCLLLFSCNAVTKIYLVRHAEKAGPTGNVDLKRPEGFDRSFALKDSLSAVSLNAIFSTNFVRTTHTAQPTATAHNMQVKIYADGNTLMDSLAAVKNKRFLVVGHSNTIPAMIRHLGLDPGFSGDIGDNDFDNLFIVQIRRSGGNIKKTLVRKTYGAPTN